MLVIGGTALAILLDEVVFGGGGGAVGRGVLFLRLSFS